MNTASRITTLRENRGLTQTELADALGINRSVLNRIEKGTRPVRDDELKLIARYFSVSTDYLLENENQNNFTITDDEEIKLVCAYRKLDKPKRQTIKDMLVFFVSAQSPHGNLSIQNNNGNGNFFANTGNNYITP